MDLNESAVFVKVVQMKSFSAAARQLGLPTSTVSTRVARLERRLGVTLLQRTTRRLSLTELGEIYFHHAAAGLGHMLEAEAAVTASIGEPTGRLRVTAPTDLGDTILVGLLERLRRSYPRIDVDLSLTESYLDLVAEGVDVAIRAGELRDSTLIAKRVGIACWALFSSPDYLDAAPPLASPRGLRRHRCLQFTSFGKSQWTLSNRKDSVTVPMDGNLIVNDLGVIRLLTQRGQGIGILPTYICREDIEAGRLVRVLPNWEARADPVHLVYPRQRFVPPKLRAFMDVAASELSGLLNG
ncbi:Transcriptional regulator, LysR family [Thioalkalivibrio nitratireducens DSM 14787]|uniref:Transcriptional regulator, LysR family n=1 Tax=Thioalkalivibrio nitratireducens (strain DSM 14787 / UNIQEM 213 / ALEN2) TaxID=1255043 RepID=L0DWC6_THIND|nr:LysR family transcriptional regulator [Thioalkalivibrio nitratireducens]AGA33280.1 Transcriptional regulator, LysR family [Thioalkalivibrio nitratireducens DSM 14787]